VSTLIAARNFSACFGVHLQNLSKKLFIPELLCKIGKLLLIAGAVLAQSCARRPPLPKGVTWIAESATFVWWGGGVNLPIGFTYQVDQGADTFEGHFTSADGNLVIHHDIGEYAGAFARRDKSFFFREDVIDGARVWLAKRDWPDGKGKGGRTTLVAVTFPDSGCANFFLESSRPDDAALIDLIARSFRPIARTASDSQCR
jgi:hypothetical protein